MKQITITISDDEEKILLTDMIDIEEWINNFVKTKVRTLMYQIIWEKTDRRPDKMSNEEKMELIRNMELKTVKERNKEMERLLR